MFAGGACAALVGIIYWTVAGGRPTVAAYVLAAAALLIASGLVLPRDASYALGGMGVAMTGALSQTSPTLFGIGLAGAAIAGALGLLPQIEADLRTARTQLALAGVAAGLAAFVGLWRHYAA